MPFAQQEYSQGADVCLLLGGSAGLTVVNGLTYWGYIGIVENNMETTI